MEQFLSAVRPPPIPDACSLIKLGGSLLTSPRLRECLAENLRRLSEFPIVLVGGGGLADVVRQWDVIHTLSTRDSHELATRTLSITADFVRRLVPGAEIVSDVYQAASVLAEQRVPIVDVSAALQQSGISLPIGWEVTSDSIAAVIAQAWGLRELILVKSVACPADASCERAAQHDLVDAWFPQAVGRNLSVSWCEGSRENWRVEHWLGVDPQFRADMLDPVGPREELSP